MYISRNAVCLTLFQQEKENIGKENSCIINRNGAFGFRVEFWQPPPQLSISPGTDILVKEAF